MLANIYKKVVGQHFMTNNIGDQHVILNIGQHFGRLLRLPFTQYRICNINRKRKINIPLPHLIQITREFGHDVNYTVVHSSLMF